MQTLDRVFSSFHMGVVTEPAHSSRSPLAFAIQWAPFTNGSQHRRRKKGWAEKPRWLDVDWDHERIQVLGTFNCLHIKRTKPSILRITLSIKVWRQLIFSAQGVITESNQSKASQRGKHDERFHKRPKSKYAYLVGLSRLRKWFFHALPLGSY